MKTLRAIRYVTPLREGGSLPAVVEASDGELNVDRTARNPNLLLWEGGLWLIDHGAALYFHHNWADANRVINAGFPQARDHVLWSRASRLPQAQAALAPQLASGFLTELWQRIP